MARVLIVDQDAATRQSIATTLEARGHDVLCADSGREGLLLAEAASPHVVVADLLEPSLQEIDFCRIIRQNALLQKQPLLFHRGDDARGRAEIDEVDAVVSDATDSLGLCDQIERQLSEAPPQDDDITGEVTAHLDDLSAYLKSVMGSDDAGLSYESSEVELAALKWRTNARLTASVSHDVGQPLAAIKNLIWACQRLIADLDGPVAEQLSDHHENIGGAASEAGKLLRRLAHFATDAGSAETTPMQSIVDRVLGLVGIEASRAGIEIRRAYCDPPALVHVEVDSIQALIAGRIHDSISAIIDSSPCNPAVHIGVSMLPDEVVLSIRDNRGPGLGADVGDYSFGFTMTDEDRRRIERVCRFVIERSGGQSAALSVTSEGALWVCRLPRCDLGKNDA